MPAAKLKALGDAGDVPSGVTGRSGHFTIVRGGVLQHVLEDGLVAVLPGGISSRLHRLAVVLRFHMPSSAADYCSCIWSAANENAWQLVKGRDFSDFCAKH
jgi:hypothetical protein